MASGRKPVKVEVATAMIGSSGSVGRSLLRYARRLIRSIAPRTTRGVQAAEPERGRQDPAVVALAAGRGGGPAAARPISGSGSTRFADAGTQPSRIASAQIAASIAPDAPSGWPYSAFVPLTGTRRRALAERQRDRPRLRDVAERRRRRVGADPVDLAPASTAGVGQGDRRRPPASRPSARGWTMWNASDVAP